MMLEKLSKNLGPYNVRIAFSDQLISVILRSFLSQWSLLHTLIRLLIKRGWLENPRSLNGGSNR